jgi:hypothetical protein
MKEKERLQPPQAADVPALMGSLHYRMALEYLGDGDWRVAGTSFIHAAREKSPQDGGMLEASAVCFAAQRQGYPPKQHGPWDGQILSLYTQFQLPRTLERYRFLVEHPDELEVAKAAVLSKYRMPKEK